MQVRSKELLTKGNRLRCVGLIQTMRKPNILGALDNHGAGVGVKLVDVGLEPAMFCLLKQKSEGVVALMRTQPDVAIGTHHDLRLKHLFIARTDP